MSSKLSPRASLSIPLMPPDQKAFVNHHTGDFAEGSLGMMQHIMCGNPNMRPITTKLLLIPALVVEFTLLLFIPAAAFGNVFATCRCQFDPLQVQAHLHPLIFGNLQVARDSWVISTSTAVHLRSQSLLSEKIGNVFTKPMRRHQVE